MSTELLRTAIAAEQDVFAVRQRGRELAAAIGMEGQDQVRIATALSEVGRQMLANLGLVEVVFWYEPGPRPMLMVQASAPVAGPTDPDFVRELEPARRLMERWIVEVHDAILVVKMARRLPASRSLLRDEELAAIRDHIASLVPSTPLQELAVQNKNLMATLEQIQAQRDELLRVNAELEETNRGVMALYTQLSDELEATNRGVVALYAELDEKSVQLRDVSEAKSRFLANVSHELRAPAAAIIGLMRLLLDPRSDPLTAEQRHQLELARTSAKDLLALVNELLDLAKAESGRIEPEWAEVDLAVLFRTLRGTMLAVATYPDVALVIDEPPDLILHTDSALLGQILRNLLTNAIKFTSRGRVELTARQGPDGMLELIVSDTGVGIALAEQERIFEEFYQVPAVGRPALKGTGLGLPYARQLATLLGGSLTLTSTPGAGSTFTVSVPQRRAAETPPALILVVDDDEAFRTALVSSLRDATTRIVEAADGRAALAAISAEIPDLVVLDLRLPELDGNAVLDHLSADEALRRIPVVVLTAFTLDVSHSSALPRASTVLGKADTTLDDLPKLIRSTLRQVAS
jgi:signal transduction histidine kinase/CheY-like chemotaxis protein